MTHLLLAGRVAGGADLDGALEAQVGVRAEGVGHQGQHVLVAPLDQRLAEGTDRTPGGGEVGRSLLFNARSTISVIYQGETQLI